MSRQEIVQFFLDDLNKLYNEKISSIEFDKKYHQLNPALDLLPDIWGGLSHYLSDEDIRAKDSEYREMQKNELKKLIGLLEKNAPLEELNKIHFLGSTD